MFLKALGLTPEQVAERELQDYDVKKGARDVTFGDQIGDGIMSLLTGKDYAKEVAQKTKDLYVDGLKDRAGARLDRTRNVAGYENLTDGQLASMSDNQLNAALEDREATKAARSLAAATTGLDRGQFLAATDAGEIKALAAKYVKDEADKKTKDAENKADQRYYDDRRDRLMDRQDARRAENRRYELEIMRLQQADKQKAQDRRDRMIMTLMSGLNNLGQAFTI